MKIIYNPEPLAIKDYKRKVKNELSENNEFNALILVYGYIEAYLREWMWLESKLEKGKSTKTIVKDTERLSFLTILTFHNILGNLDKGLYNDLKLLNSQRNKLVHKIIEIDLGVNKKTLKQIVCNAIKLCDVVVEKYEKAIAGKTKTIR